MSVPIRETDLYAPVKSLLEGQGYEVKSEIRAADIVAIRNNEPPIIIELKNGFSLTLLHQAIDRLKMTETVYVAVPEWTGRAGWKAFRHNKTLCRRLGLGIITVNLATATAQVHLDPGPYQPRQSKMRQHRLLGEFHQRVGDPNTGGQNRVKVITAYRQDALRCTKFLAENGPTKASEVAKNTKVKRAGTIMRADHYGWFARVSRGIYQITPQGKKALKLYRDTLEILT